MSDSAKTVLWLGIIMIAVGIILRWSEISAVIFGSGSSYNPVGSGYAKRLNSKTSPTNPTTAGESRSLH